ALKSGRVSTQQGSTDYNQYLRFGTNGLTTMYVDYTADKDDNVGDYLVIQGIRNTPFFEYQLEFESGFQSKLDDCTSSTCSLDDLEDTRINIFGTDYTIVDTSLTSSQGISLELMGGDVSDTLREGETKTYTIDGTDYEVSVVFISNPNSGNIAAKLAVNGELTSELEEGETDTLSGGLEIGVRSILVNDREGIVEFFLGADKITLTDSNYTDGAFDNSSAFEVGTENIEDAAVKIVGSLTGSFADDSEFQITDIRYRLTADPISDSQVDSGTDGFGIAPGHGVREYLKEPQGMLNPTWDLRYEGLTQPEITEVKLDPSGDDKYDLVFTNLAGKEYEVRFVEGTTGDVLAFGNDEGNDHFWFMEGTYNNGSANTMATCNAYGMSEDDYFLVSNMGGNTFDDTAYSYVLQFDSFEEDDGIYKATFNDLATGDDREVVISTSSLWSGAGAGTLTVGGYDYDVVVCDVNAINPKILVDLNGNDSITLNDEARVTVKGGAILDLSDADTWAANNATANNVTMMLVTPASNFDEQTQGNDTLSWMVVSRANQEVGISTSSLTYTRGSTTRDSTTTPDWNPTEPQDNDELTLEMTDFGALVELNDPSGSDEAETLTIHYPEEQVEAQVFVVAGSVERTESGSGGSVTTTKLNPITVGLAMLDKDAPAVGSTNMIVVGGPCANTVAAELLNSGADCTEGFTPGKAMIKSFEHAGGKVSLLVAGYSAQDTVAASYVLAQYEDYDLSGSEVEVVAADLSSIQVNTVG
ncbi:hypothetical protein D6783_03245, partial [Candidatus Woesearchaeota archaeon]